jgi:hypothetical protein
MKPLVLVVDGLFAAALIAAIVLAASHADSTPILAAMLAAFLLLPVALLVSLAWALGREPGSSVGRHALSLAASATLALLAIAYALGTAVVDRALAGKDYGAAYSDCHKVWATRGLVAPGLTKVAAAGNTAATVNNAFAHGAPGVEIDVYYDPALADFVVSHDFPYERKGGAVLMLQRLLAQTDPTKHYWLDFKRHGQLTRAQAEAAAARLGAIADGAGVARPRLWIEGTEPFNLMPFERAGFSIIFDVHPPADRHLLTPFVTELHKAVFLLGGFTVMGMNYGTEADPVYGPVTRQHLGDIPVFLYHVPTDRALLARIASIPQVRVLMAGDHSAMVYDIDACGVSGTGVR